jgi:hypothetical protein
LKPTKRFWFDTIFIVSLVILISGCASTDYIHLKYTLPPEAEMALKGKRVYLQFTDARSDNSLFGDQIKKEFRHFTGKFSFTVGQESRDELILGAFDINALFREAFKIRLENQGIEIMDKPHSDDPSLEIVLETFLLDQKENKWTAQLKYQAVLVIDPSLRASQTVSGDAQRLRVPAVGKPGVVLGEIFSDMVNRLNLPELFKKTHQL